MKTTKSKKATPPKPAATPVRATITASKKTATKVSATTPTPVSKNASKKPATKAAATTPAATPVRAKAGTKTEAKAPVAAPTPAPLREITTEVIAARAYSLWEQRGRPQGQDVELWIEAEQQLKASQSYAA